MADEFCGELKTGASRILPGKPISQFKRERRRRKQDYFDAVMQRLDAADAARIVPVLFSLKSPPVGANEIVGNLNVLRYAL